ncbi:hypothetical protein PRCB_02245 [Pantoea rodasii]|uniref:Uncharacterized protein n=1 Tax=Pantoea rodasii TaxID=1076549 RepID=A0A2M9WIW8_9GAMM|nr:hypothetical protein [Pantoea rodasii]ORM64350.1 hypothetical protein HA45_11115 [Pantoea rodasii]PJZ07500.1 hypothetical protein PRCB_02245 [Pantoea rodasii]
MQIDNFKIGRFELRKVGEAIQYYISGEQVQYVELAFDSPERVTLDVLKEMYDRESYDSGLKWEV